jgi:hypothetical protein
MGYVCDCVCVCVKEGGFNTPATIVAIKVHTNGEGNTFEATNASLPCVLLRPVMIFNPFEVSTCRQMHAAIKRTCARISVIQDADGTSHCKEEGWLEVLFSTTI